MSAKTTLCVGDSNLDRLWKDLSSSHQFFSQSDFVLVTKRERLDQIEAKMSSQTKLVVINVLPNFLCDELSSSEDRQRLADGQGFLSDLFSSEIGFINLARAYSECTFIMVSPYYRKSPHWYKMILGDLSHHIGRLMSSAPPNFRLISPKNPEVGIDGVHFQTWSGVAYFREMAELSQEPVEVSIRPATIVHRLDIIDTRLGSLTNLSDLHDARMSEEADNLANERSLHRVLVKGLQRLQNNTQPDLVSQVFNLFKRLAPTVGLSSIRYVRVLRVRDVSYNVEMSDTAVAKEVKSGFEQVIKKTPTPDYLNKISISYIHTVGTRVRISLMRSVAKRRRDQYPNLQCSVTAFTARPVLRIGDPSGAVRFLTFVDAMLELGDLLTPEDKSKAASLGRTAFPSGLRSKFLVLNTEDPDLRPPNRGRQAQGRQGRFFGGTQESGEGSDGPSTNKRPRPSDN